ncbi:hypothetical protein [Enorma phocaeensis]|nr:hypothetical protein [Enorma phocaeensis]
MNEHINQNNAPEAAALPGGPETSISPHLDKGPEIEIPLIGRFLP